MRAGFAPPLSATASGRAAQRGRTMCVAACASLLREMKRCVPVAPCCLPPPPLGDGSAARPHHGRRRVCVAVARDACRSRSALFPPKPLLGEGSAAHVCRRRRVAFAHGRHDACRPRSALALPAGEGQCRLVVACFTACASRPREPGSTCAARAQLPPLSQRRGRAESRGRTMCAAARAMRSRETCTLCAARAPPSTPPVAGGEGSAARQHHARRRGHVAIARVRHDACRSRSALPVPGHCWGRAATRGSSIRAAARA